MTAPRTAAGRALLDDFRTPRARQLAEQAVVHWLDADDVLAIEAEARAALLADIRKRVEGLFGQFHPMCAVEAEPTDRKAVSRKAVLAILAELDAS